MITACGVCIMGFYYENEEKGMDKMARKTKYEIRTLKQKQMMSISIMHCLGMLFR